MDNAIHQRLAQLEQRLAESNDELQKLRAQLGSASQRPPRGRPRGRAIGIIGLAVILAGIGLLLLAGTGEAQAPDAKVDAAKAKPLQTPFRILNKAGKVVFAVEEIGISISAPLYVNDSGGGTIMAVEEDAAGQRGILLLSKDRKVVLRAGESQDGALVLPSFKSKARLQLGPGGIELNDASGALAGKFELDKTGLVGSLGLAKQGEKVLTLDDKGLQVFDKGAAVGQLGFSPTGSGHGYLRVADAKAAVLEVDQREVNVNTTFNVKDKAGKLIMAVEEDAAGHRGMLLLDSNQKVVVKAGDNNEAERLVLASKTSKARLVMGASAIMQHDIGGDNVIRLGLDDSGLVGTFSVGKAHQSLFSINESDRRKDAGSVEVRGWVELFGRDEKKVLSLNEQGVQVFDKNDQPMVVVGTSKQGNGLIQASGKTKKVEIMGDRERIHCSSTDSKAAAEIGPDGMFVNGKDGLRALRAGLDDAGKSGRLAIGSAGTKLIDLTVEKETGTVTVLGNVAVFEPEGGAEGKLLVELNKDGVRIFNKDGNAVGRFGLSGSGTGAGFLAIANSGGSAVVEAGMISDGRGEIRAVPYQLNLPDNALIPTLLRGRKPK